METVEVLKVKLEFEHEVQRLAHEEAQKGCEAAYELRLAELKGIRIKSRKRKGTFRGRKRGEHELEMAHLGRHPPPDRVTLTLLEILD